MYTDSNHGCINERSPAAARCYVGARRATAPRRAQPSGLGLARGWASASPVARSRRAEIGKFAQKNVVSRIFASWNQLEQWLRQMEGLQCLAWREGTEDPDRPPHLLLESQDLDDPRVHLLHRGWIAECGFFATWDDHGIEPATHLWKPCDHVADPGGFVGPESAT